MDRYHAGRGRQSENGRVEAQHHRNVVHLERPDREGQRGLFPHSGANGNHRVRAATDGRGRNEAHPYNLPRSHERVWLKMAIQMSTIGPILPLVFGLAFLPSTVSAHRLDEYLQAT